MTEAAYLKAIGDEAADGAPDQDSADLWRDTAIAEKRSKVEQAFNDFQALQWAKRDLAAAAG
jgi:hypothetical protein